MAILRRDIMASGCFGCLFFVHILVLEDTGYFPTGHRIIPTNTEMCVADELRGMRDTWQTDVLCEKYSNLCYTTYSKASVRCR